MIGGGNVQIPNPWCQHDTLAEMNEATGFEFSAPDTADGLAISAIQESGTLAEVIYSDGTREIAIRKGTDSGDISGDYNVYSEENTITAGDTDLTAKGNNGTINLAVWTDGEYSYSISCFSGLSADQITEIAAAMK